MTSLESLCFALLRLAVFPLFFRCFSVVFPLFFTTVGFEKLRLRAAESAAPIGFAVFAHRRPRRHWPATPTDVSRARLCGDLRVGGPAFLRFAPDAYQIQVM